MKKLLLSGFVSGLVMTVLAVVCNILWQKFLPGLAVQYQTPLFRPWSDPAMSLIFVVPFLSGFVMAAIWQFHRVVLAAVWWKFAAILSVLSVLGMVMTYSCFPISVLMVTTWTVTMIIEYFAGTWVLMKMNK